MLRSKSVPLIIVCGIGALGWAGCGGSSDSGSSATEPDTAATTPEPAPEVTKADYIAAADKTCKAQVAATTKLIDQLDELNTELQTAYSSETAKQIQKITSQLAANRAELTKDLQGLEEPATGGADAYLESRRQVEKAFEATAEAWGDYAADESTVDALNEAIAAQNEAVDASNKLAEKYGFKVCGAILKK